MHKEDRVDQSAFNREIRKELQAKAPLTLVVALIATVALCTILSVGYAWKSTETVQKEMQHTISKLQKELYQMVYSQNDEVSRSLVQIKTGLAVAQSRQEDIKELIKQHVKKGVFKK